MGYINWFFKWFFNIILLVSIHNIWDNPSHWLIFFKMVIAPPFSLESRISETLRRFIIHGVLYCHCPCHNISIFFKHDIPCIKLHHFVQSPYIKYCNTSSKGIGLFSKRLAAVQSYKGVQHLSERNTELFSQRLAGVQSWCAQEKGSLGRRTAQVQN